jgi:hypothetical protein
MKLMKTFKTFIKQQIEIEEAYDGPSPNPPKRVTDTTYHVSDYTTDGNNRRHFTTREIHKSKVKDHYRLKFGEVGAKVLSKHPHFNEEIEIEETATTSDKEPVIVPAHRSASGKRVPAKTVMRAKHRAIVNKGDNPSDGE